MKNTPEVQEVLLLQLQQQVRELQRELAACRQREADARRLARTDGLTGLPNRRVLEQQADQLLDRHAADQAQMALLFVDLDSFKTVNDRHGHAVGDALLRLVGLRLRHAMRRDDLACRIGGDEFVCLLQALRGPDEVPAIEAKLHAVITQPCHLGELTLSVRPSIGAAIFPRDGRNLSELLAHADRAMYRGKQSLAVGTPWAGTAAAAAGPAARRVRLRAVP